MGFPTWIKQVVSLNEPKLRWNIWLEGKAATIYIKAVSYICIFCLMYVIWFSWYQMYDEDWGAISVGQVVELSIEVVFKGTNLQFLQSVLGW